MTSDRWVLTYAFNRLIEDILFSEYITNDTKATAIFGMMEIFEDAEWDLEEAIAAERIPFVGDSLFEKALDHFRNRS